MYDVQIFQLHGSKKIGKGAIESKALYSPREGLKKKRKVGGASKGVKAFN